MKAIETVIFDVGGVLDRPGDLAAAEKNRFPLAERLGLELEEMWPHLYGGDLWKQVRVGKITEDEFWDRNLTPFGIDSAAEQRAFTRQLFATKELVPEMRTLLKALVGRVKLAIISNATDRLESFLENRLRVTDYFDVIVNSARVGVAKPEKEIYEIGLARLGVCPEQAIFIDDQERNVEAANNLGIHGVLYTGVKDLSTVLGGFNLLD